MNVLRMAKWLTARGHRILIFAPSTSPLYKNAAKGNLPVRHFSSNFKYGDLINARRLATEFKREKCDLVILHTGREMLVSVIAKLLSRPRIKLIYQQHMHLSGSKRDMFHSWEYRHFDAWIAPLLMYAARVALQTSISSAKIFPIPFGIDTTLFSHLENKREVLRNQLSIPPDAKLVGVVGRLDPKKGQDILLRAAAILHESGIEIHILFAGDTTHAEGEAYSNLLHSLAVLMQIENRVHFLPHTEDVAAVYAALDIFALTSHSETYGMVTIEAMASGLPVIGTDDGGTSELIDHEVNGLLVNPIDPEDLALALKRLLSDPNMARRLGINARKDVLAYYSKEVQCSRLESLFSQLRSS